MKIGLIVGEGTGGTDYVIETVKMIEALGLDTAWLANVTLDAMTLAAVLSQQTSRIEIGTAVVPTFTRHPVAMLQQATSTQLACQGRFTLGIGLSHKFLVEGVWGLSYDKPARHMRSYLEALAPGLRGEPIVCSNELYQVDYQQAPGLAPKVEAETPLLMAALGPLMLRLAGEMTAGTITWAAGIRTISEHIVPNIAKAASSAGRDRPRVVAGLPILLTDDAAKAKARCAKAFAAYGQVPSYRAMLDREGAQGIEDIAIIGDEETLRAGIRRLKDAGVTDLCVFQFKSEAEELKRTLEFLAA